MASCAGCAVTPRRNWPSALSEEDCAGSINCVSMADLPALLAVLEHDPDDAQALAGLASALRQAPGDLRATQLAAARKGLRGRGPPPPGGQLVHGRPAAAAEH